MRPPALRRLFGLVGLVAVALWLPACRLTTNDLIRAVSTDDLELARRCLDNGVEVNKPLRFGFNLEAEGDTPLTVAAQRSGPEMVRFLLQRGAEVNQGWGGEADGTMPLGFAAVRGHDEIARILIEAGARIDALNADGVSPLGSALVTGHFETADLLLEDGAVPRFAEFKATVDYAPPELRVDTVRWLLEDGLDPAAIDDRGRGLVAYALEKPAAEIDEIARILVEAGARVDTHNALGRSPLASTLIAGDFETAGLLLEHGASPGFSEFSLVVDHAAPELRVDAVRWLLEHGLDPAALDHAGRSLVVYATEKRAADVVELLGAQ